MSFLIIVLILVSSDTFFWGTNGIDFFRAVPRYGAIIVCLLLFVKPKVIKLDLRYICILSLLLIPYILSCFFRECSTSMFVIYLAYIFVGYFVATRISFDTFSRVFEKTIYFICCFSIVIELIAYIIPSISHIFPIVTNTADHQIVNFVFSGIELNNFGSVFLRNHGIFWEPGVFQIYINFALIIYLFYQKKFSIKKVLIYSLSIFITFSTAGYIVYAVIMLSYFLNSKDFSSINKTYRRLFVFLFSAVLLIVLLSETSGILYDKLFSKFDMQNGSFLARFNSIVSDFYMVKSSPWIGVGMGNINKLTEFYARQVLGVYADSNSNGVFYQFAAYGLIFGFTYLFGLIGIFKRFNISRFTKICLCCAFLLMFFGERLESWFPYVFMFYGYTSIFDRKNEGLRNENSLY